MALAASNASALAVDCLPAAAGRPLHELCSRYATPLYSVDISFANRAAAPASGAIRWVSPSWVGLVALPLQSAFLAVPPIQPIFHVMPTRPPCPDVSHHVKLAARCTIHTHAATTWLDPCRFYQHAP